MPAALLLCARVAGAAGAAVVFLTLLLVMSQRRREISSSFMVYYARPARFNFANALAIKGFKSLKISLFSNSSDIKKSCLKLSMS